MGGRRSLEVGGWKARHPGDGKAARSRRLTVGGHSRTLAQVTALGARVPRNMLVTMAGGWTCSVCGATYEGIPLEWGYDKPAYWDERADVPGSFLNSDLCVLPRTDQEEADY